MTKRNWKGTTTTVVAILMGTSLLMNGQAYAASETSLTSTTTQNLDQQSVDDQNNQQAENVQFDQMVQDGTNIDLTANEESTTVSNQNKQSDSNTASSSDIADQVISEGLKYKGVPYKFGSSKKTTRTFDCSSFTQRVFKEVGVSLPRDSRQQSKVGQKVSKNQLQKGDLVFFRSYGSSSSRITHVAIYAGDNKLLHTYGKPGVTTTKFKGTSWEKRFELGRRVI
ncbi:C40 family peptidase [Brevibacillus sp. HB1.2]|uniref:C40 family peptidase n=1 Tax=Brevibacillus TaxID=55080 RepID=UPI0003725CDA|nr:MULTISPECIES: C40 family peptidase [unclassified Brevibacillus]ATF13380.1 hydrolase [Brevibacillus brevis X23]NRS15453.1 C40 family peptidase [Brevibacillus sp. HB1.4B]NTU18889.1 C40 family peptidase [Brevibacillus sp. HB1.2]NTU29698.1 C40 family peptidase [Brevibacillus sp. HB1.1]